MSQFYDLLYWLILNYYVSSKFDTNSISNFFTYYIWAMSNEKVPLIKHAQNVQIYPAHARSIIQAFALHSYIL